MSDEAEDVRTRLVPLDALLLDPNNPRLIEDPLWQPIPDADVGKPWVQEETRRRLLAIPFDPISVLMQSIDRSGWFDVEPVRVRALDTGALVVVDGNRRVVALRLLEESHWARQDKSDDGRARRITDVRVTVVDAELQAEHVARAVRHTETQAVWTDLGRTVWQRELRRTHPEWSDLKVIRPVGWRPGVEVDDDLVLDMCVDYRSSPWGGNFESVGSFELFRVALRYESIRGWLGYGTEGGPVGENLSRFFAWLNDESKTGIDRVGGEGSPVVRPVSHIRRLADLLTKPQFIDSIDLADAIAPAWTDATIRPQRTAPSQMPRSSDVPWPVKLAGSWPGLASLAVHHYRGLAGLELVGLTKINMLVGVNNAGKTSVLEAIHLLCRLSDPRGLLDTIRARVRRDPETLPDAGLAWSMPARASISGTLGTGKEAKTEHIKSNEPGDPESNIATFLAALRIEASYADEPQISFTQFHTDRPRHTQIVEGAHAWLCPVVFHSPFSLAEWAVLAKCYKRSLKTGTKTEVVDFIRQHVDDDVEDILLADTEGQFLVIHRTAGRLDLSSHGEGMQRIFQIGLLFAEHAHGVVLIDEFENALHTSVLTSFSRMIQELAVRFDVQVFLTTHSDEALQAFLLNDYRTEDVTTFLLKKEGGRISVRRFDGESHLRAVEAAGTDVRRL